MVLSSSVVHCTENQLRRRDNELSCLHDQKLVSLCFICCSTSVALYQAPAFCNKTDEKAVLGCFHCFLCGWSCIIVGRFLLSAVRHPLWSKFHNRAHDLAPNMLWSLLLQGKIMNVIAATLCGYFPVGFHQDFSSVRLLVITDLRLLRVQGQLSQFLYGHLSALLPWFVVSLMTLTVGGSKD